MESPGPQPRVVVGAPPWPIKPSGSEHDRAAVRVGAEISGRVRLVHGVRRGVVHVREARVVDRALRRNGLDVVLGNRIRRLPRPRRGLGCEPDALVAGVESPPDPEHLFRGVQGVLDAGARHRLEARLAVVRHGHVSFSPPDRGRSGLSGVGESFPRGRRSGDERERIRLRRVGRNFPEALRQPIGLDVLPGTGIGVARVPSAGQDDPVPPVGESSENVALRVVHCFELALHDRAPDRRAVGNDQLCRFGRDEDLRNALFGRPLRLLDVAVGDARVLEVAAGDLDGVGGHVVAAGPRALRVGGAEPGRSSAEIEGLRGGVAQDEERRVERALEPEPFDCPKARLAVENHEDRRVRFEEDPGRVVVEFRGWLFAAAPEPGFRENVVERELDLKARERRGDASRQPLLKGRAGAGQLHPGHLDGNQGHGPLVTVDADLGLVRSGSGGRGLFVGPLNSKVAARFQFRALEALRLRLVERDRSRLAEADRLWPGVVAGRGSSRLGRTGGSGQQGAAESEKRRCRHDKSPRCASGVFHRFLRFGTVRVSGV